MSNSLKPLFFLSLVVKLIIALLVPLVLDEYYYWFWGQNLQWSYFDHPPMVGWIMALGDWFKFAGDGALRWPFAIISHGTIYIWLLLVKDVLNEQQKHIFLWVLILNPMTGWGGITGTPDVPLLFFWSAALLTGRRLIQTPTLLNYFLFGSFLGLGFLSKYIIVVFLVCLLAWIWGERLWKTLATPKVVIAIVAGIVFCLPVVFWNMDNDWASFNFQWKHGTSSQVWQWHWPIEYVLGQVFIIFPVFTFFVWKNKNKAFWLSCFAFLPLLFFFVTSLFSRVEANWPSVGYPAIYALAIAGLSTEHLLWVQRTIKLWGFLLVFVVSVPFWLPSDFSKRQKIKILEAEVYEELIVEAQNRPLLWANSYQMASFLSFHSGRRICKLPKIGRPDFFNFIPECSQLPDKFSYAYEKDRRLNLDPIYPDYQAPYTSFHGNGFVITEIQKK